MSKPAQMAVAPLIVDYRATPRRVVDFAGYVREHGAAVYNVTVTDLSLAGCGITCEVDLEVETQIWLKIPGLVARRARIAWGGDGHYGCEFSAPFATGALDSALAVLPQKTLRIFR